MVPLTLPPRLKRSKTRPLIILEDRILVPLTRGHIATVDLADLPVVAGRAWGSVVGKDGCVYAKTTVTTGLGERRIVLLHRVLCGVDDPAVEVDHRNGDGLENRRFNLRVCSRQQNSWNRGLESTNTTGFKGVSYRPEYSKYEAKIRFHVRRYYLGMFDTAEEAAMAYDAAAEAAFGDYARLNFPPRHTNARSLRSERPAEPDIAIKITDMDALLRHMSTKPHVRAVALILAQRAVDDGLSVPGVRVEQRRVA